MRFATNDAPVLLVFGQSNAAGHATHLPPEEQLHTPMTRVFRLSKSENQHFGDGSVVWTGYTSDDNNLAEDAPETVCLATEAARLWQRAADRDPSLPPLYILSISIGSQGITERFMWYPDRPRKLVPGPLGTADISMYPLSLDVITRAFADLRKKGLNPRVLGLHWLGGEEETGVPLERLDVLPALYRRVFAGWREAAGCRVPVLLYRLCSRKRSLCQGEDVRCFDRINAVFGELAACEQDVMVFDPRRYPGFDPEDPLDGLYGGDAVHFKPDLHRWFAREALLCAEQLPLAVEGDPSQRV